MIFPARKSNIAGLLSGLKQYCDEHPEAKRAKALYDEKLAKHDREFRDEDDDVLKNLDW